jgi:hypothetical protein
MKANVAIVTLLCVAASGCATVDLANTGRVGGTATVSAQSSAKVNVVQRAASKLYAAFTSNGWVEKRSKKRVQSAASVLLRGLDATDANSPLSNYETQNLTLADIALDIEAANSYVVQTTKAAEVYLAMASDDTNLREELASLQKALIASREAEMVFKSALTSLGANEHNSWMSYATSVNNLRDVTDKFGDRVRSGVTLTSALQPAES